MFSKFIISHIKMSYVNLLDRGFSPLPDLNLAINNLRAVEAVSAFDGNFVNINGLPYKKKGSFRAGINPVSNPDPIIGGLIIPAGSGQMALPITTSDQSLGEANPFLYDPGNKFSFTDTTFTLKPGRYSISFDLPVLNFDVMASDVECKIAQIMDSNFMIFMGPPVTSFSMCKACTLTVPFSGLIWSLSSCSIIEIDAEKTFHLIIEFNNTTSVVLPLTACVCVSELF